MVTEISKTRGFKQTAFLAMFIIINLGIFFAACQTPIQWQQSEVAYDHFYWSSRICADQFNILQTGLHFNDLWKIFYPFRLEVGIRTRQIATFIEMIFFKFLQYFNSVNFHDPLLVFIHLLNVLLVYKIMVRLTRSRLPAAIGAMLLLNSGISLSTILFPFRIAKILIVTFFLTLWLMLLRSPAPFPSWQKKQRVLFYVLIILSLFSDETFILFLPILGIIMVSRDQLQGFFRKVLLWEFFAVLLACVALFYLVINVCFAFDRGGNFVAHQKFLENFKLFQTTPFLKDSFQAFWGFFLRRMMGYWDRTPWGLLSGASFLILLVTAGVQKEKRPPDGHLFIVWALAGFIVIKALLLPHPFGHHRWIMPDQAGFPSLLFFSYYYPYIDAVFIVIILSILLATSSFFQRKGKYFVMLSVCLISISNLVHIEDGLKDTLRFHHRYYSHQDAIPKILKINPLLPLTQRGPLYLSFPSGSRKTFSRILKHSLKSIDPEVFYYALNQDYYNYSLLILPQFLRLIEQKRIIVSLNNFKTVPEHHGEELKQARYFYDVYRPLLIDLQKLHPFSALEPKNPFSPLAIKQKTVLNFKINDISRDIVFFIKGAADISWNPTRLEQQLKQQYGESYQAFKIRQRDLIENERLIQVRIRPVIPGQTVFWVGPFYEQAHLQ